MDQNNRTIKEKWMDVAADCQQTEPRERNKMEQGFTQTTLWRSMEAGEWEGEGQNVEVGHRTNGTPETETSRSVVEEVKQSRFNPLVEIDAERVTGSALRKRIAEQNYRCALSGIELTPETCSLDHIDPLSNGGKHVMSNVQLIHRDINRMKGEMTQDEFIGIVKAIHDFYGS